MSDVQRPGSPPPCRLYILNDNRIFVEVLARYLDQFPDLEVVGTGLRGPAAYHELELLQPEVVVVDPGPRLGDIEPTILRLRQALPGAAIVALSQPFDDEYAEVTRRAGVEKFVVKIEAAEHPFLSTSPSSAARAACSPPARLRVGKLACPCRTSADDTAKLVC